MNRGVDGRKTDAVEAGELPEWWQWLVEGKLAADDASPKLIGDGLRQRLGPAVSIVGGFAPLRVHLQQVSHSVFKSLEH